MVLFSAMVTVNLSTFTSAQAGVKSTASLPQKTSAKASYAIVTKSAFLPTASSEITTVDGRADIFAAGLTSGPTFDGGGGSLPIEISLSGGVTSVSFSATGQTNCCGSTPNSPPDGGSDLSPTDINNYGGISGIKAPNTMMLVGVFLGSGSPSSTSPSILDFNTIGMDFTTLSPELQQTFFIGDGLTSGGESQAFIVPTGATRLFLGIADAGGFKGDPSWYDDNTGSFEVTVTQQTTGVTPTPTATAIPTLPPLPTPSPIPSPSLPPVPTLPPIPSPSLQPLPSPTALPTLPPIPTPTLQPFPSPTLPPGGGGVVFGFVNDFDDNALKGVTVTITGDNYSNSTETDDNGYYEFSDLAAGDYTLTYEKDGYQTETQETSLGEDQVKELGTVILEEIVKAKISGYVMDISDNPIESAKLKLKGIKTNYKHTTSSDADGFFEFTDLEADTYILIIKKKGYKRAKQTIRLEEGESKEVDINLKKTSKGITTVR